MSTPSFPHAEHHPWIVEFTELRAANERQQQTAEAISRRTLNGVLRLWTDVVTPGASLVEQDGGDCCSIHFETRSQARKFIGCFGGKLLARSAV